LLPSPTSIRILAPVLTADSRHRRQDLRKRVGLQQFLDPPGQHFALVEHGRVLQPRSQDPFQRGMDLGQQAVHPVGDPGGLTGQVIIEADDHRQLGDHLVLTVDRPQRVGHRSGGVRDDERVLRVGPGLAGIEVGDPPHRQAGQVGDGAAHVPRDRQRQSTDGSRLVDNDEHRSVLGLQLGEEFAQLGFGVG
jgi:hypothetical protein